MTASKKQQHSHKTRNIPHIFSNTCLYVCTTKKQLEYLIIVQIFANDKKKVKKSEWDSEWVSNWKPFIHILPWQINVWNRYIHVVKIYSFPLRTVGPAHDNEMCFYIDWLIDWLHLSFLDKVAKTFRAIISAHTTFIFFP